MHDHEGVVVEPYVWKMTALLASFYAFFLLELIMNRSSDVHSHVPDEITVQVRLIYADHDSIVLCKECGLFHLFDWCFTSSNTLCKQFVFEFWHYICAVFY